jgi:hypothetical protein
LPVVGHRIPKTGLHSGGIATDVCQQPTVAGPVHSLSVDAHRRRHDDSLNWLPDEPLEQHGGAEVICADIAGYFVHRLADADFGCQMNYGVDALQAFGNFISIPDIPLDQLGLGGYLDCPGAMHLFNQRIENPYLMPAPDQLARYMAANEAAAASYQDTGHDTSCDMDAVWAVQPAHGRFVPFDPFVFRAANSSNKAPGPLFGRERHTEGGAKFLCLAARRSISRFPSRWPGT